MEKKKDITLKEFIEVFKLPEGTKVTKATLKQYTKYLRGTYLLWKALEDIDSKNISTMLDGKRTKLHAYLKKEHNDYQEWIKNLGTEPALEIQFEDKNQSSKPFWTYTRFGNKYKVVEIAYEVYIARVLTPLQSKFMKKYDVKLKYELKWNWHGRPMNSVDVMGPIKLRGVEYIIPLQIKLPNKEIKYLTSTHIRQTITNQHNIWCGDMLEPVKRIIEEEKIKN
jgi:hypothetical protein